MALSYADTKKLIDLILDRPKQIARKDLNTTLQDKGWSEPQFYNGVLKHGPGMPYTAEQWFDFYSKIPTHTLRDTRNPGADELLKKLSPEQIRKLPEESLGAYPAVEAALKEK